MPYSEGWWERRPLSETAPSALQYSPPIQLLQQETLARLNPVLPETLLKQPGKRPGAGDLLSNTCSIPWACKGPGFSRCPPLHDALDT